MEEYLVKEIIEALKIHLAEYLRTVWKTFAALMLSIGWLLSSESTRTFIAGDDLIKYGMLVILVCMALFHLSSLFNLYKKSAAARDSLGDKLDGLLLSVTDTYSIPLIYPIASFAMNGLLFIELIGLIILGK